MVVGWVGGLNDHYISGCRYGATCEKKLNRFSFEKVYRVCLVLDPGFDQVLGAAEGGDVGMCVSSFDWNVEQFSSQKIARTVEST